MEQLTQRREEPVDTLGQRGGLSGRQRRGVGLREVGDARGHRERAFQVTLGGEVGRVQQPVRGVAHRGDDHCQRALPRVLANQLHYLAEPRG